MKISEWNKNGKIMKNIHDDYKNHHSDFVIEIIENKIIPRSIYKDVKISYILKIENKNDPTWKIPISDPSGYINDKQDRNKLLNKVMEEVKKRIDLYCDDNDVDDIIIGEPTLDLTVRRNKL